jgi:hypothetical protein
VRSKREEEEEEKEKDLDTDKRRYAGTCQDWTPTGPFFDLDRPNPCSEPDDWLSHITGDAEIRMQRKG